MDVIVGVICLAMLAIVCIGYLRRQSRVNRSPAAPTSDARSHASDDDGDSDGDAGGDGGDGGDA